MHQIKHDVFWLPELGWLVSFNEVRRNIDGPPGGAKSVTLRLCFRCADLQPYFIEQELYLKAAKSYSFAQSEPTHIKTRFGKIGLTAEQQASLTKYKPPPNVLSQIAEYIGLMEEDSKNAELLRRVASVHRGEPTGREILKRQLKHAKNFAPYVARDILERCVQCGDPALPGEKTCFAHQNK